MRKVRFFVSQGKIKGNSVLIDGQEFRHLNKVLRLGIGADVSVLSDDETIRECKIVEVNKDFAVANVLSSKTQKTVGADITVFQALIKSDPLSFSIQKCTELGVGRYVPFKSEYGVIEDKGQIKPRLQRIAQASCKQCGRLSNILVEDVLSFDEVLEKLEQFDAVLVAYEKEHQNAKSVISKLNKDQKIAIIIGSEGGFSQQEILKLTKLKNTKFLSLGKLILRADTAVVALVSAIKYELGDFTNENSNADFGV